MPTIRPGAEAQAAPIPIIDVVQQAIDLYRGQAGNLLPVLHAIQDTLRYIPAQAVPMLAEALQLSRAEIHGVIRFYPYFHEAEPAPVVLEVCKAESCQAMGGTELAEYAKRHLGCEFNQTSACGGFTLLPVYCLGLCASSPAVMINSIPHARMTPACLEQLLHNTEAQS